MNFLPVKVTAAEPQRVQIELPNRQQVWLPVEGTNVQVGSNLSLGIRPEHLLPSHDAEVTLEGDVQVVEQLGKSTFKFPLFVKTLSIARTTWCWLMRAPNLPLACHLNAVIYSEKTVSPADGCIKS